MRGMNRTTFYAYVRKSPCGGRLTQSQMNGIDAILNGCEHAAITDPRQIAYILATAFHETGGRMNPVREGFAATDAQARKIVAARGYGRPDPQTGQVYYGRGLVQLTWGENYRHWGALTGLALYQQPDLALDPVNAVTILIQFMTQGPKKLDMYFNGAHSDPLNARQIVNAMDKAPLIAGYYKNFLDALEAAQDGGQPADVTPQAAQPDKPSLIRDPATIGMISSVAGSGALGSLSYINSPWAFAAFAVVALGVFLFFTGRLKIVKTGGV